MKKISTTRHEEVTNIYKFENMIWHEKNKDYLTITFLLNLPFALIFRCQMNILFIPKKQKNGTSEIGVNWGPVSLCSKERHIKDLHPRARCAETSVLSSDAKIQLFYLPLTLLAILLPIIWWLLALQIHRGFIFLSTIVLGTFGIQEFNISNVVRKPTQKPATGNPKKPHHLRFAFNQNLTLNRTKLLKPQNLKSIWKSTRNCPTIKS